MGHVNHRGSVQQPALSARAATGARPSLRSIDDRTCHVPGVAMTTPPFDPIQAEFQALYPPHMYFAMSPDAQAMAWANFVQSKQLQAQHAANRDSMQATLVAIFVLIPMVIGFIVFIMMGVSGAL
jgi:hypothetical protein